MNRDITTERFDGYLRFLGRAIVLGRLACQASDAARAEAILDAVHNVPRFLRGEEYPAFENEFRSFYLEPLVRCYPDLQELADLCP